MGKTETMVWDVSADSEGRKQWIRAKFSDDNYSESSKQYVCDDLYTLIEISEE